MSKKPHLKRSQKKNKKTTTAAISLVIETNLFCNLQAERSKLVEETQVMKSFTFRFHDKYNAEKDGKLLFTNRISMITEKYRKVPGSCNYLEIASVSRIPSNEVFSLIRSMLKLCTISIIFYSTHHPRREEKRRNHLQNIYKLTTTTTFFKSNNYSHLLFGISRRTIICSSLS